MADKWTMQKIAQGFHRANDIKVSSEAQRNIETIAVGHLATGNLNGFITGMSTLNKIEAEQAVVQDVAQMKVLMNAILGKLSSNNVGDDVENA
jgi:hypothetical protein